VAIKLAFPSTTTHATGASDNGSSGGSSWTCQTAEVGAARSAQICGTLSAASSVTTITIAISGASQPRTGIGQEYSGVVHFGNATGGTFTSTASVHGTSTLTYSGDYAVMAVASAVSTTSMAVHTPSSNCAHTSCGTIPSTNVQVYATQITVTDEYNTYAGTGSIDIWGTLSYSGGSGAWATLELENQ
jgi:hypothetical protein